MNVRAYFIPAFRTGQQVKPLWVTLGALLSAAGLLSADVSAVKVRGTLATYEAQADASPRLQESTQFEAVLDGTRSSFVVSDDKLREVWSSDGGESYELKEIAPRFTLNGRAGQSGAVPMIGRVFYGSHVLYASPEMGVVWFAFTPHLKNSPDGVEPPAFWKTEFTDPYAHAFRLTNVVFLADAAGARLAAADFAWSLSALDSLVERSQQVTLFRRSIDPKEIKTARDVLRSRKLDGHIVARYRTVQTTNFAQWVLPAEFRFELLDNNGKLWTIWHGFVHEIEATASLPPAPALFRPTQVTDYRFYDKATRIDEFTYLITNNVWLGTNDLTLRKLFDWERTRAALARPRFAPTSQRALMLAVVVIALIAFPVLVLRWKKPGEIKTEES